MLKLGRIYYSPKRIVFNPLGPDQAMIWGLVTIVFSFALAAPEMEAGLKVAIISIMTPGTLNGLLIVSTVKATRIKTVKSFGFIS